MTESTNDALNVGRGLTIAEFWTQLQQALTADGVIVGECSGPAVTKMISDAMINFMDSQSVKLADHLAVLITKWELQATEHGVRQFTGNDHRLFANELRSRLEQAGMSPPLELADQLRKADDRIAMLEAVFNLQVEAHQQTITQCQAAKIGQLKALLKLESASLRAMPDVDTLSNIIRTVDGNHSLGAGGLAEAILTHLDTWDVPLAAATGDTDSTKALDVILDSLFPGKWDRHTRDNWREPVAKALCKALPHLFAGVRGAGLDGLKCSLQGAPMMLITLPQVVELLAAFGGDNAEMAIQNLPERTVGNEQQPAGLYAYSTDYPDEGIYYLGEADADCAVDMSRIEELLPRDAVLIKHLAENCLDLRCISTPTGGGNAEVEWIVISHHHAEPREREVGRAATPREAILSALTPGN